MTCFPIDLHIHSTASDGTVTPMDILSQTLRKKMQHISLTDHESIEGYKELLRYESRWKNLINIIPGVELHTFYKGYEVHLLGYLFDINNKNLNSRLKKIRVERTEISFITVENLRRSGMDLKWEDVLGILDDDDVAITKAHIISAIKDSDLCIDKATFFDFFNPKGKFYIPYKNHSLEEAIYLIKKAGGVPILAHPGLIGNDDLVKEIIHNYHIGIEIYYHYFGEKAQLWREKYLKLAQKYNLVVTGGSDYHGSITPVEIGDTYVPPEIVTKLKEYTRI